MPLMPCIRASAFLVAAVVIAGIAAPAQAQEAFPAKPIRMILPSAAGAGGDALARVYNDALIRELGQQIIIDNRPGASGNVAAMEVLKSAPDGYTLFQGNSSTQSVNPHLFGAKATYNPLKDFKPVIRLGAVPNMLIVSPSLNVKSVGEFIALAKKEPGKLSFSSGGLGTTQHLAGELFNSMAGVSTLHVPYKGAAQGTAAVIANEVSFMLPNVPTAIQFVRQGRLQGLAVTTPKRVSSLPDLPTLNESGLTGYDVTAWVGIFAPARTPDAVVQRLAQAFTKVNGQPEVRERLAQLGYEIGLATGEEFQKMIVAEYEKWGRIVKTSGVTIN
jgi:tripartite-type tricarboxylate transporter receptor subunit TctC